MGITSNNVFLLPGGEIMAATEIAECPFNMRDPAKQLHITPGITTNSLLSTNKFADANYITIFDKESTRTNRGVSPRNSAVETSTSWC
jgi:hypothetical protein